MEEFLKQLTEDLINNEQEMTKHSGGYVSLKGTFKDHRNENGYTTHTIGTVEYNIPTEEFVTKIKPLIEPYAKRTLHEKHIYYKNA